MYGLIDCIHTKTKHNQKQALTHCLIQLKCLKPQSKLHKFDCRKTISSEPPTSFQECYATKQVSGARTSNYIPQILWTICLDLNVINENNPLDATSWFITMVLQGSVRFALRTPGGRLIIKKSSYQYRDSHVKDKTVSPTVLSLTWESPYLGKMVFILRRDPRPAVKTSAYKNRLFHIIFLSH